MMFEAYVTNLEMYPERGVEVGEYLRFPTTIEEVQALFSRIGIDGKRYEEYFITDYQSDVLGLYDHLGEYESLDELNFLAHLLEEMTPDELEKLEAVMDAGEYTGSVKDLINLTQNLDCFEFYPGVKDEEELGRMYILEFEALTVPEHLIDYIDYEAYGRDVRINEGGHFALGGYVFDNQSKFIEHYEGTIYQYNYDNVISRVRIASCCAGVFICLHLGTICPKADSPGCRSPPCLRSVHPPTHEPNGGNTNDDHQSEGLLRLVHP